MSDHEVVESRAFRQLEQLVRGLGDELATFRRRAQIAEARVKSLESAVEEGVPEASVERLKNLERENADMKERVGFATQRVRQLSARLKFMRQQQIVSAPTANGSVEPAQMRRGGRA
jgi:hypothetical protein